MESNAYTVWVSKRTKANPEVEVGGGVAGFRSLAISALGRLVEVGVGWHYNIHVNCWRIFSVRRRDRRGFWTGAIESVLPMEMPLPERRKPLLPPWLRLDFFGVLFFLMDVAMISSGGRLL